MFVFLNKISTMTLFYKNEFLLYYLNENIRWYE